jgi:hypothetical protein
VMPIVQNPVTVHVAEVFAHMLSHIANHHLRHSQTTSKDVKGIGKNM